MNAVEARTEAARHVFFFVDGKPVAQGSKRAPVAGVVRESSKGLRRWRSNVAITAKVAGCRIEPAAVGVAVGLVFVRARPKTHRNRSGKLRPNAPVMPSSKPDVDKLMRAVLDALTGVAWADDCQTVVARAVKVYGARQGLGVIVQPILGLAPGQAELHELDVNPEASCLKALAWWPQLGP